MAKEKLTKERAVLACTGVIVAGGSVVYAGVQNAGTWGTFGIVLGVVGIIVWCGDILRRTKG